MCTNPVGDGASLVTLAPSGRSLGGYCRSQYSGPGRSGGNSASISAGASMIQRYRRRCNQTLSASRLSRMREMALVRSAALAAMLLIVAGCGVSSSVAGRPVPVSAVRRLTAIAEHAARQSGDKHPVWATVVLTTHAKALTLATPGDYVPGSNGVPVYLLTIRGHFVCNYCTGPAGSKAPTGRYISLVLNAKTLTEMDFGLAPKAPPVAPASL